MPCSWREILKREKSKRRDIEIKRAGDGIQPKFKDIIVDMKINKSIKR